MQSKTLNTTARVLLLFVGFINYLGFGLVFPLFTFLLFDTNVEILPKGATDAVRGLWLGGLLAIAPALLFFSSPILGTFSDIKGRKKILSVSLLIGIVSYLIAVIAIMKSSLTCLILSRVLYGISSGSMTVVQAGLVDLSSKEDKQKNFGLYNMALGAGFSLGPFIGSVLTKPSFTGSVNYLTPFIVAAILMFINWLFILWKLKETHVLDPLKKHNWKMGILHLKKAVHMKQLRMLFLVVFIFFVGWNFFTEFVPLFLIKRFEYAEMGVGSFYAYTGILFALCAGILIRPVIARFTPKRVLETALIGGGLYFFLFLFIKQSWVMWLYLPPLIYFIAMVYPTATTVISNETSSDAQGEVLGIYGSIQSLALIVSPFFAGTLVAQYPFMPIVVSGGAMLLAGILLLLFRLAKSS